MERDHRDRQCVDAAYPKIQRANRSPEPRPTWKYEVRAEHNSHVRIGAENYYLSADGKLMPARKDQPPPDLSYFKQVVR